MKKTMNGFTIVELLIVIVIIAILAAISIVAYSGIQNRARASQASSALSQAKKKLELYKIDNNAYPTTGNLASAGVSDNDTTYQYTSDGSTFCLTATAGTISYTATNTTNPSQGGCAGHGQGGVAAVTNWSQNPSLEGGSLSGYDGPNGSTISLSSTRAKDGVSSVLVTLPTTTPAYGGVNVAYGYSVPSNFKANTTYAYSAWVYVPTSTVNVMLSAQGPGIASSNCNSSSTSTKNAWVRLTCTFSTSTSGTVAIYVLNTAASTAGMQFNADSIMFTEGPAIYNYADGNSSNWIWNGTANNSTSTGPPL